MKRLLILIFAIGFSLAAFSQAIPNYTGTGWRPVLVKSAFKDSVYFNLPVYSYSNLRIAGGWYIGTTSVTATGAEINKLAGFTGNIISSNDTSGMLRPRYMRRTDTINLRRDVNLKASIANPTFTGIVSAPNVNNIRYANQFAGADAGIKIEAAMADLPATGGIVDARGLEGAQTISVTINFIKPTKLILGAATYTYSGTANAIQFEVGSGGSSINGMIGTSIITSTTGNIIGFAYGSNGNLEIRGLKAITSGAGKSVITFISGNHISGSYFSDLTLNANGGNGSSAIKLVDDATLIGCQFQRIYAHMGAVNTTSAIIHLCPYTGGAVNSNDFRSIWLEDDVAGNSTLAAIYLIPTSTSGLIQRNTFDGITGEVLNKGVFHVAGYDGVTPRRVSSNTFRNCWDGDRTAIVTSNVTIGAFAYETTIDGLFVDEVSIASPIVNISAASVNTLWLQSTTLRAFELLGKSNITSNAGLPAVSGTSQYGGFRLSLPGSSYNVLDAGIDENSPYSSWLQSTNSSNLSLYYPLLLNPRGGKIGIANTSPGELLTLGTAGTTAGVLSLAGSASGKAIIQTAAAAGAPTLTLPTSTGTFSLQGDTLTGPGQHTSDHRTDLIEANLANSETVPSWVVTFGVGGNNPADTLAITDSTILGDFYNGTLKTMHVDSVNVITGKGEGLDTIGIQIQWHKIFKTASATKLWAATLGVGRTAGTPAVATCNTTGILSVSFTNATIPAGVRVWCTIPYHPADALKRKPKYISVSMFGHYN